MFVLSVYQKLRLQLAVRDKLIQRQQNVLTEHGLDGKVIPPSHMYPSLICTPLFHIYHLSYIPLFSCVPPSHICPPPLCVPLLLAICRPSPSCSHTSPSQIYPSYITFIIILCLSHCSFPIPHLTSSPLTCNIILGGICTIGFIRRHFDG